MVSGCIKERRWDRCFLERLVLEDTTSSRVIVLQPEVKEVTGYVRVASGTAVCLER